MPARWLGAVDTRPVASRPSYPPYRSRTLARVAGWRLFAVPRNAKVYSRERPTSCWCYLIRCCHAASRSVDARDNWLSLWDPLPVTPAVPSLLSIVTESAAVGLYMGPLACVSRARSSQSRIWIAQHPPRVACPCGRFLIPGQLKAATSFGSSICAGASTDRFSTCASHYVSTH